MLKALFDFLATELTLTKGTTFHMGLFPPASADNATCLSEHVGSQIDPYNTAMRWHRFQLLTRNTSLPAGLLEAERISELVIRLRGEAITGFFIYDVTGNGPAHIGQDEKGRHEFSQNVSISARKE